MTIRVVMCKGTWIEDNYTDFLVFPVQEGESDDDAIYRAGEEYSHKEEFYIVEKD
jgi:hypothetical protein